MLNEDVCSMKLPHRLTV